MTKYVGVSRVAMLDGKVVEAIEIKDNGVEIYPDGTIIQIIAKEKSNATAKRSRLP